MLDSILSWVVLLVPVVLGVIVIAVPARHEDEKGHMRWRYALGVCLILYGAITWWQQSRDRTTAAKERQKAVQETAAETSKQVTATVSDLYSHMISEQKTQIANLESELKAQSRNLDAIKGSDIVTGKKPVRVELTNPGLSPTPPAPVLSGIRIASQKQVPSDDPSLPFALEVVVQTDVDIVPVKLAVLCDGPIGKGNAGFEGGGAYTMVTQGLADGNDHIFVTKWETPAWTAQRPIIVRLSSRSAIRVIGLSRNVL
jgi:hypothetical protein